MEERVKPEEFGGYKCEFVSGGSIPPNHLACSLCNLLLRDPCQVDCCGAKYCQTCLNHLRAAGQPCNVCKKQLGNAEPDANLQRLVVDQKVYCSRKDTNGCEWKGKLLNLACHEDDQNECPYQPINIKQMIQNMEERRKKDLKILIFVLSIMAVGLSLLLQFMTTTTAKTMEQSMMSLKQEMNSELTTSMKKTEESLMSLKQEIKQEMNSELTTAVKKTEESLMSLKQEMNGEFAAMTKEMEEKIYRRIYGGIGQ